MHSLPFWLGSGRYLPSYHPTWGHPALGHKCPVFDSFTVFPDPKPLATADHLSMLCTRGSRGSVFGGVSQTLVRDPRVGAPLASSSGFFAPLPHKQGLSATCAHLAASSLLVPSPSLCASSVGPGAQQRGVESRRAGQREGYARIRRLRSQVQDALLCVGCPKRWFRLSRGPFFYPICCGAQLGSRTGGSALRRLLRDRRYPIVG